MSLSFKVVGDNYKLIPHDSTRSRIPKRKEWEKAERRFSFYRFGSVGLVWLCCTIFIGYNIDLVKLLNRSREMCFPLLGGVRSRVESLGNWAIATHHYWTFKRFHSGDGGEIKAESSWESDFSFLDIVLWIARQCGRRFCPNVENRFTKSILLHAVQWAGSPELGRIPIRVAIGFRFFSATRQKMNGKRKLEQKICPSDTILSATLPSPQITLRNQTRRSENFSSTAAEKAARIIEEATKPLFSSFIYHPQGIGVSWSLYVPSWLEKYSGEFPLNGSASVDLTPSAFKGDESGCLLRGIGIAFWWILPADLFVEIQ